MVELRASLTNLGGHRDACYQNQSDGRLVAGEAGTTVYPDIALPAIQSIYEVSVY
jgi:hypothetical protein